MSKQNYFIKWASLLAATGVAFGALGAHKLKDLLNPVSLAAWETGVRYQLFHALAILIISLNDKLILEKQVIRLLNLFIIGIVFFSGSVYLLSTQSITGISVSFLGPITPIGGVLMITGWIMLFLHAIKSQKIIQ